MKSEYLFTDKKYREEIETLKVEEKKITKSFFDIENGDCWMLSLHTSGSSAKDIETLSDLHDLIMERYNPIIITNECSSYYNKTLYPFFNNFERKLRKLLYLKSALNQNDSDNKVIQNLEQQDLGSIFDMLFTDTNFINSAKQKINEKSWKYSKDEILESITEIPENVLWDSLIGVQCVPTLRKRFFEVRKYRNDTMHAHNMNAASFKEAKYLIETVNDELDKEIKNVIGRKESHQTETDRQFNSKLATALNTLLKNYQAEEYDMIKQHFNERLSTLNAFIPPFSNRE